jgi:CPA2 family monovalent cation:H+ antiporter-2
MAGSFLTQAIVFLAAGVLCVPIAKRLGLSSVLGYLIAGILIGPFVLGLIGQRGEDVMHVAEFGVVMMLFLVGLELEPAQFWNMRKAIAGLGSLQMGITTLLLALLFGVLGWHWQVGLVVALSFAMSSTAIVLQTLKERGNTKSVMGQSSFAVLLFQDIAIIPILALLPLLATPDLVPGASAGHSLIDELPAWLQTLVVLGAVGMVYVSGKYLVVPLLRIVAQTRLHELFTASALLLVLAVAFLMQSVGLSPALGAFLAGVVLANSEFRHELESDIAPFKGLLLGLFFIGVGASINFYLIMQSPWLIMAMGAVVTVIKFSVLFGIGRIYKLSNDQNLLFAFGLSQVGEFAFVLLSFAQQINLIPGELANQMMAITAISMFATPFLLLINERWIDPYFGVKTIAEPAEGDVIDAQNPVIIAGFGHFGSTIGRLLRANGIQTTILDHDSDRVNLLRKMGFKVYYGDATRLSMLKAAGIENAKLFIAAIDSPETNARIIETLRKHYPHLKIFARARNRVDAYELIEHGVENIYRETLYTAVNLGVDALVQLGQHRFNATRQGQKFIQYDEISLKKLAKTRHNRAEYVLSVKEEIELQEQLLENDLMLDLASDNPALFSHDPKKDDT